MELAREQLLRQCELWHEEDEHQKIIAAIQDWPEESRDYEMTGILARSLNNQEEYGEALLQLDRVCEKGKLDPLWHYRRGYAYYYMKSYKEAREAFQQAAILDPDDEDSLDFIQWCDEELEPEREFSQDEFSPEMYQKKELDELEDFIISHFGEYKNVFHELVSPDIHVDICVIYPTPERNYYTLVTMGMGAHDMNVPEELTEQNLERAELVICLPSDWQLPVEDEVWYWPLRWLKLLARVPIEEDSWVGWGHTVSNDGPLAENTMLSALMLISPGAFEEAADLCTLSNGEEINFYQVIPLYQEELEYKIEHGAKALLELMNAEIMEAVDISRKNVCKS